MAMTALVLFVFGLVLGGGVIAVITRSRLSRLAAEKTDAENESALLRTELDGERRAHSLQLEQLNKATQEKIALVTSTQDGFKTEMKAISADVTKEAVESLRQIADEARTADREAAAGELNARTE